jgi:hypothetical protein
MSRLRDAFVPNRRVQLASDVAGLCAALLLIGLLGAAFTWWGRSDLFDLASSSLEAVKIDTGFLVGPILILVALPLVLGRSRQLALTRYFRTRLLVATLLWLLGLGLLLARIATLDASYTLEAGAYVSAGLMILGLLSTLAMWPGDLPVVKIDRNGMVRGLNVHNPQRRMRLGDFLVVAILGDHRKPMLDGGCGDQGIHQFHRSMHARPTAVGHQPGPRNHDCLPDMDRISGSGKGKGVRAAGSDVIVFRVEQAQLQLADRHH